MKIFWQVLQSESWNSVLDRLKLITLRASDQYGLGLRTSTGTQKFMAQSFWINQSIQSFLLKKSYKQV